MAYLLRKSIFIHTPKTAGQWVAAALDNAGLLTDTLGPVHTSPDEISQEAAFRRRAFRFTFVRHPFSWYLSMWAHRMDEEWEPIDDLDWFSSRWIDFWAEFTNQCRSNQFEEFVRKCIEYYPAGFVSNLFDAYTKGCSFVGKQETLISDLSTALDQAGESYNTVKLESTKPKNVRGSQSYRKKNIAYSSDLIELVINAESKAIKVYGYEDVPLRLILDHVISQTP